MKKDTRCENCGKKVNGVENTCHGCGMVVCVACATLYGHILGGNHGKPVSNCARYCENCTFWDADRLYGDCSNDLAQSNGVTRTHKHFGCIHWEVK